MANKLTGDVPYYRTVPSSPEPDEDEVVLPGEDDIIEDEMSPELPENEMEEKNEEEKPTTTNATENQQGEKEEDEETILRRRLLEKKMEKDKQENEKKMEAKKQPEIELVAGGRDKLQRRADPTASKRERIVWNREERREREKAAANSSSRSAPRTTGGESSGGGRVVEKQQREREEYGGKGIRERHDKPSSSAPSSTFNRVDERRGMANVKHGRGGGEGSGIGGSSKYHHQPEAKGPPSANSGDRHHRRGEEERRRASEKEEKGKRPREQSRSSSSTEDRGARRKSAKKETGGMESTTKRNEEQQMEEVSPEHHHPLLTKPAEVEEGIEELAIEEEEGESPPPIKKPKKYSKFESSPEESDEEEGERKQRERGGRDGQGKQQEEASEDEQSEFGFEEEGMTKDGANEGEEREGPDDDLPENKEFDELTEQEKAMCSFRNGFDSSRFLEFQLSPEKLQQMEARYLKRLVSRLPVYYPGISGCRSVVEYECLNKISEGTFGVVYRAQERRTDEIVALKRLKMEKEHQGFPITSLREINMLLKCGTHPNVLNVREVVVGSSMDKIYMVMEYVEHDMKSLMELMQSRNKKWTIPQVKTLLRQLLSGIEHMHEEYVIHRDLKTSNLLLSHQGILKIGDFGLAREFGEPIKPYTPIVVTLWYRSPELLLGTKIYSTPVDMWSIGCIFGEFLKLDPMFPGRTEIEQLQKIFKQVGAPNEQIWPGCMDLPGMKTNVFPDTPYNQLRRKFAAELPDDDGYELLNKLLALDPAKRLSATVALKSKWFQNDPKPAPPSSFPTWPAKSEHNKKPPNEPVAPRKQQPVGGFTLKFDVPKF